jgi:hypothetical protein
MRSPARALVTVLVLGVLAFVLLTVLKRTDEAFSLNVPPSTAAVELPRGATACQDVDVPIGGGFDAARVRIGTVGRPGPAIDVVLRDRGGRIVARDAVPAGYADNTSPPIDLGPGRHVGTGYRLCLRNRGPATAFLYGSGGDPNPNSDLTIDGKPQTNDLALTFQRPARSLASASGDVLHRATLFRSPRLSTVAYALLLLVLLAGAAVATVAGVRSAAREDAEADARDDRDDAREGRGD